MAFKTKLLRKRIVGIGRLRQDTDDNFVFFLTKEGARIWDLGMDGFATVRQHLYESVDCLPIQAVRRVAVYSSAFAGRLICHIDLFESGNITGKKK